MRKYFANFNSNGTSLMQPLEDTNRNRIIKDIRECAEGNCYDNNSVRWWVEDEDGREVASGYIQKRAGKISYVRTL